MLTPSLPHSNLLVANSMYLDMINLHTFIFFSSRSKDIVEPLIKPQWYVDCQEMADMAVKVHKALNYHVYMYFYSDSVAVHVWKTVHLS